MHLLYCHCILHVCIPCLSITPLFYLSTCSHSRLLYPSHHSLLVWILKEPNADDPLNKGISSDIMCGLCDHIQYSMGSCNSTHWNSSVSISVHTLSISPCSVAVHIVCTYVRTYTVKSLLPYCHMCTQTCSHTHTRTRTQKESGSNSMILVRTLVVTLYIFFLLPYFL